MKKILVFSVLILATLMTGRANAADNWPPAKEWRTKHVVAYLNKKFELDIPPNLVLYVVNDRAKRNSVAQMPSDIIVVYMDIARPLLAAKKCPKGN